jgi:hypothetical protein
MRLPSTPLLAALAALLATPALAQPRLAAPTASPNPHAGGPLTVRYVADGSAEGPTLEVFDLLGRRAEPSAPLAAGVYLYRLRYDDGRVSEAGRLTQLLSGPLDVQLLPDAVEPASPPARADAATTALMAGATEAATG